MDHATHTKIYQVITTTLRELGIADARFSISDTTILIRHGSYIGRSFVCGSVRVVIVADGNRIEFYDQSDNLLRLICLNGSESVRGEAA